MGPSRGAMMGPSRGAKILLAGSGLEIWTPWSDWLLCSATQEPNMGFIDSHLQSQQVRIVVASGSHTTSQQARPWDGQKWTIKWPCTTLFSQ